MLTELAVKNFRSCEDVRVSLGSALLALVGKNGVGKTNLLHSIRLASRLCAGTSPWYELEPQVGDQPASLELTFEIDQKAYKYTATRTPSQLDWIISESLVDLSEGKTLFARQNGELSTAWHKDKLGIGPAIGSVPAILALFPSGAPGREPLLSIAQYLERVRYYRAKDGIRDHDSSPVLIMHSHYKEWLSNPRTNHADSVALRLIRMIQARDERYDELMDLLGQNGLGLIDEIFLHVVPGKPPGTSTEDQSDPTGYVLLFVPGPALGGAGRPFPYSGLSAGTRRVIQMLTYLIYDEAAVALFEEPEDSMHWGLLQAVIDIFRSYSHRSQFIFSTHSSRAINMLAPEGIRVVKADAGKTEVHGFSGQQLSHIRHFARDSGTLAEYLDTL